MESPAVCTLFEGHYHYGLGALVNSLYRHGFRSVVWAGYRGSLPPWATPLSAREGYQEFSVGEGCVIRFIALQPDVHFANYKPDFMLRLFGENPGLPGLLYFDPDIIVRCRWSFFEEWIECGIALVQDITNGTMPSNHPLRMQWTSFATAWGYQTRNVLDQYFNSGFVGLTRRQASCLHIWQDLLTRLPTLKLDMRQFMPGDRSQPFFAIDQDTLNMMTMFTEHPLSTIGPEGMDFVPGGFTMSHAVGSPKPWHKRMIACSLDGRRPSPADHAYLLNAAAPIRLYTDSELAFKRLSLRCAAAIGRLWNRS